VDTTYCSGFYYASSVIHNDTFSHIDRECLLRVLLALVLILLVGCATPSPFVLGEEVKPPTGCQEGRERGVDC
jgi:hypothetical protein